MRRILPLAALLLALSGCTQPPAEAVLRGSTMGTLYTLRVPDCPPACARELGQAVDNRLRALTLALSHYEEASALSAFNRHAGTDWYPVPSDLALVMQLALEFSTATDGAFDVTAAAAIDAWGFGPMPVEAMPAPATLERARRLTDFRQVEVRLQPPAVRKADGAIRLDLSAIGKGFAADQLALLLEARGLRDYLIDIGGDMRCAGARPDGTPWRIGIERPADSLGIRYIIVPGDAAVAGSGNYRNVREFDGRRMGHTIDPATAAPTTHTLEAVNVVAPSAAQADALATALIVMGPERGFAWALERDLAAVFFVRGDAGHEDRLTPAFRALLLAD